MTSKEWSERLGMYDVRESAHEDFWTFCPCHYDQSPRLHVWRTLSGEISMRCMGCGIWMTRTVRAAGKREAEQVLRDAARKSWRRTEDKWEDVHPSEIPIGRGWGCNPDA